MERDYAFEALAEVSATNWEEGRGQLNAALRSIRAQSPEIVDNYLLSCEIHDRAQMYRECFEGAALTPTALAKHWMRVKEQRPKRTGANLYVGHSSPLPPSRREQNLEEARKILAMFDK